MYDRLHPVPTRYLPISLDSKNTLPFRAHPLAQRVTRRDGGDIGSSGRSLFRSQRQGVAGFFFDVRLPLEQLSSAGMPGALLIYKCLIFRCCKNHSRDLFFEAKSNKCLHAEFVACVGYYFASCPGGAACPPRLPPGGAKRRDSGRAARRA